MSAGSQTAGKEKSHSTRLFLPVIVLAVFVAVMTNTIVNVVLPDMREEFGVSAAQVAWVVTGSMLAMAIGVPLYGKISDFFSLRHLFSVALLIFAVGSLICAVAPNLAVLVFGRVVNGAGEAGISALAFVAVARLLPPGERGGALGLVAASVGAGSAVGPIAGGFIGGLFGWRVIFLGLLSLMLILTPLALRVLPDGVEEGKRSAERRVDLAGGILLGLAAALFLFGITQGQVQGFASFSSWGSFLGAALAATGFARRITSTPNPFISPKLLKNRIFVAAVIVGFFTMLANLSAVVFVPLLIVEVNSLSPGAAGLALTPGAAALAILSPLTGRLSDRIGVKAPILAGLTIMGLSVLFISTFGAGASPLLVSAGMLGVGVAFALTNPATTNAAANALPEADIGVGLGIFQGVFFLGGGVGPALIGALLVAREEAAADAINPLYALGAAPFSDAFLAMAVAVILALVATLGLRSRAGGDRADKRTVRKHRPQTVLAHDARSPSVRHRTGTKATREGGSA